MLKGEHICDAGTGRKVQYQLFGEIAIHLKFLTAAQVVKCLREQASATPRRPLGLIAINFGFLSDSQLQAILAGQRIVMKRRANPSCRPTTPVPQRPLAEEESPCLVVNTDSISLVPQPPRTRRHALRRRTSSPFRVNSAEFLELLRPLSGDMSLTPPAPAGRPPAHFSNVFVERAMRTLVLSDQSSLRQRVLAACKHLVRLAPPYAPGCSGHIPEPELQQRFGALWAHITTTNRAPLVAVSRMSEAEIKKVAEAIWDLHIEMSTLGLEADRGAKVA